MSYSDRRVADHVGKRDYASAPIRVTPTQLPFGPEPTTQRRARVSWVAVSPVPSQRASSGAPEP